LATANAIIDGLQSNRFNETIFEGRSEAEPAELVDRTPGVETVFGGLMISSIKTVSDYLNSSGLEDPHQRTLRHAVEKHGDGLCWGEAAADTRREIQTGLLLVEDVVFPLPEEQVRRVLRPDGALYIVGSQNPAFDRVKRFLHDHGHQGCSTKSNRNQLYWGGLQSHPSCPREVGDLPLVVSYYTEDSPYELLAARLRASCEAANLECRILPLKNRGCWEANTAAKADVISDVWKSSGRPVLWVDADAVIHKPPTLLAGTSADFAIHKVLRWKFASGTVFFNQTALAGELLERWCKLCREQPCCPDQVTLDVAWDLVTESRPLQTLWLPQSYTKIFDMPTGKGEDREAVIEHFQASRQNKGKMSGGLPRHEIAVPAPWRESRRSCRPAIHPDPTSMGHRACVAGALLTAPDCVREAIALFARQHGLALEIDLEPTEDRLIGLLRFSAIKTLFERGYDAVMWLSVDAVPVRLDVSPSAFLKDGKDLYLVRHIVNGHERPDLGVFLIRNSEWSQRLLTLMYEYCEVQGWEESAALLNLLGYCHLLDLSREPELNGSFLDRIEWLDLSWNSVPGLSESASPIILRYATGTPLQRMIGVNFCAQQTLARFQGELTPPDTRIDLGSPLLDSALPAGQWHQPEHFRWSATAVATLPVTIFPGQTAIEVELATGNPTGCSADLAVDGRRLGSAFFEEPGVKRFRFDLGSIAGDRVLSFAVRELWQPSRILPTDDDRWLGIAVGGIRLYAEPEPLGLTVLLAEQAVLDPPAGPYRGWLEKIETPVLLSRHCPLDWTNPPNTDLVITHEPSGGAELSLIRRTMESQCPVLVLSAGFECDAEKAPPPGHKFACLGRTQARRREALWGGRRCEVVGLPCLDGQTAHTRDPHPDGPFRVFVSGRNGNSDAVRGLRALQAWFAKEPRVRGREIIPVWSLADGLDTELGVPQEANSTAALDNVLPDIDAVFSTIETDLLRGLIEGLPVAAIDYSGQSRVLQTVWSVSADLEIEAVMEQMIEHGPGMESQRRLLADTVECSSPAAPRLLHLIETMRQAGRRARMSNRPLTLPNRIVQLEGEADFAGPEQRAEEAAESLRLEHERLIQAFDCDTEWLRANQGLRMDAFRTDLADTSRAAFHLDRYRYVCQHTVGRRVLDVASGTGYGAHVLASEGRALSVMGVESDVAAVDYARRIYGSDAVRFVCSRASGVPLPPASFDVAVSFETLEHVEDEQDFLRELHRLLCPGGMLILSTPNQWGLGEVAPYHVRDYDRQTLRAALEPLFTIEALFNQNSGTPNRRENRGRERGIEPTTDANAGEAECFLAIGRRKDVSTLDRVIGAPVTDWDELALRELLRIHTRFARPFSQPPIPKEAIAVRLSAALPQTAKAGSSFPIRLNVENHSIWGLRSVGATPVNAAYQWLDLAGTLLIDGMRTPIAIAPRHSATLALQVASPLSPGVYELVVTLVQEGLYWFHGIDPAIQVRAVVTIV
jgi:2-polyprenyl-3-methyl-5-hydroxy-6-metoxy-1,4-benzoquinol methylase